MANHLNSTRAPVAHHAPTIDPGALPEIYTIRIHFDKLEPYMRDGEMHVFSTVEPFKKGDIVGMWRRPDLVMPGELPAAAYRLVNDLPADLTLGDWTNARSPADFVIYVESTNPRERFAYRASELVAIHKWVGKLHPKQETYKLSQIEREANKEPAAMTSNVPAAQSGLSIFKNEKFSVRGGIDENGEPWFVAKDVAVALGYTDHTNAIKQHCRGVVKRHPLQTAGGAQEVRIIHEPDVYRLIFKSQLETAQEFEDWVVSEVLPSIRKTGGYSVQPQQEQAPQFPIPQTFAEALMLAASQAAQIEHQKARIEEKNAQIADMREDVQALDRIAGADDLFGLREAVAMLQTSQNKFVAWLQRNGWAYRQTGTRRLLAYADKRKAGYATNKAEPYTKKDGSEGVGETLKFYPAGIIKLAKLLNVTLTEGDLHTIHSKKGDAA